MKIMIYMITGGIIGLIISIFIIEWWAIQSNIIAFVVGGSVTNLGLIIGGIIDLFLTKSDP